MAGQVEMRVYNANGEESIGRRRLTVVQIEEETDYGSDSGY